MLFSEKQETHFLQLQQLLIRQLLKHHFFHLEIDPEMLQNLSFRYTALINIIRFLFRGFWQIIKLIR
jgi:hypothetical protein